MKENAEDEDSSCAVFFDIRISFKKDWEIVGIVSINFRDAAQHGLIVVKIHKLKPLLSPAPS